MHIRRLEINNFRGIKTSRITLSKHSVLIGDNNTGKTTILEAIDLVLGPDRLNRAPPIDEHDFYQGKYIAEASAGEKVAGGEDEPEVKAAEANAAAHDGCAVPLTHGYDTCEDPRIEIEVTITDLTEEQKRKFGHYIEFWDTATNAFYTEANPEGIDAAIVTEALILSPKSNPCIFLCEKN